MEYKDCSGLTFWIYNYILLQEMLQALSYKADKGNSIIFYQYLDISLFLGSFYIIKKLYYNLDKRFSRDHCDNCLISLEEYRDGYFKY